MKSSNIHHHCESVHQHSAYLGFILWCYWCFFFFFLEDPTLGKLSPVHYAFNLHPSLVSIVLSSFPF